MSSWIHVADDGKHAVFRCWGCKALGVTKIGEGHTLGACYICKNGGRRR
jgi:hypothetical protein